MNFTQVVFQDMNSTALSQDRVQWQDLVKVAMKLQASQKPGVLWQVKLLPLDVHFPYLNNTAHMW
jgi:hypothetical protein